MINIKSKETYWIKGYQGNTPYTIDWYGNMRDTPHQFCRMMKEPPDYYWPFINKLVNRFDKLEFYCWNGLRDTYVINPIKLKLGVREFMRQK
jgi:hypothetical protein